MKLPTIKEIAALCSQVKSTIEPEFRAYEDDEIPGILLTVGADGEGGWNYQTGDTQFSGGAYGFHHWGQAGIHKNTNCREAARTILDEIRESIYQAE